MYAVDKINEAREEYLTSVFESLYGLLETLRDRLDCSFACSSMLLGALTKELSCKGMLEPRVTKPFHGYSLMSVEALVLSIKTPEWSNYSGLGYSYGARSTPHSCKIVGKLEPTIEELKRKLQVFKI